MKNQSAPIPQASALILGLMSQIDRMAKTNAPFQYDLDTPLPRNAQELVRKTGRTQLNLTLRTHTVFVSFMVRNKQVTICVTRNHPLTWADAVYDLQRSVVNAYNHRMRGCTILHNMSIMPPIMGYPHYFAGLRSTLH